MTLRLPPRHPAAAACLAALAMLAAGAQAAPGDPLPTPRNEPWLGPLQVAVDATDLDHHILRITETLPVRPGPLTLLLPQWIPGHHSPSGELSRFAGLQVTAGGQPLPWVRDTLQGSAFHVQVPAGVSSLTLQFQHLAPTQPGSGGRMTFSPEIVHLAWDTAVLYPAGHWASAVQVSPRLRLPAGWQASTALRAPDGQRAEGSADGWFSFGTVPLETLVDSPVFAGRHTRRIELDPPGTPRPVTLDLVADNARLLEADPAQIEAHRRLVQQADKLYGARHFRHYDLMLTISSEIGGVGLEHHESSENGVRPGYFKDWDKAPGPRDLLPHEYTHSWNGKFRRPADLWTPNYNVPMQDSLLWIYEGQTQYWGRVLAARSGLVNPAQARWMWAVSAAGELARTGRQWRPLQDTTNEPAMNMARRKDWTSWQRSADYYHGLLWLDVDTQLRTLSQGSRSLDDVARRFFGVEDGRVAPLTYTFEDYVALLNAVQPFDWAAFLRERLDRVGDTPLTEGLERAGWRLAWSEKDSPYAQSDDEGEDGKRDDHTHSLGMSLSARDGRIGDVRWDGPAFRAGLAPGVTVLAVNGDAYKPARLAEAITANKDGQHPISLIVRSGDHFRTVVIDWRGGLRYPVLERIEGRPDLLSAILQAR